MSWDAAAHVDEEVRGRAETIGLAALEELATEALVRFDPDAAAEVAALAAEHRDVTFTSPGNRTCVFPWCGTATPRCDVAPS